MVSPVGILIKFVSIKAYVPTEYDNEHSLFGYYLRPFVENLTTMFLIIASYKNVKIYLKVYLFLKTLNYEH